jgi:hypothetical protein
MLVIIDIPAICALHRTERSDWNIPWRGTSSCNVAFLNHQVRFRSPNYHIRDEWKLNNWSYQATWGIFDVEVAIKAFGGRNKRVRNFSTKRTNLLIIYNLTSTANPPSSNQSLFFNFNNFVIPLTASVVTYVKSVNAVHHTLATLQRISSILVAKSKFQSTTWMPPKTTHLNKRPIKKKDCGLLRNALESSSE